MSNVIPSIVGTTATNGAVTATIAELEIPDGFFGIVSVDLTAEQNGSPANAYAFHNVYLVSGEGAACTIRDATATPIELDPGSTGVSTTVDANGQNLRVQGTGTAGNSFTWVAHIGATEHERDIPVELGFDWWISDRGLTVDSGNAEPGDQISNWADQGGSAHDAPQATDAKQPTVVGPDADGNYGLSFDGTADCLQPVSAGAGWGASTSHTFYGVIDSDDAAGTFTYLLDSLDGADRLALAALTNTAGKVGVLSIDVGTTWYSLGDAVVGPQILDVVIDDAGNRMSMRRAGVFVGEAAYANSVAFGAATALGAKYDASSGFFDGTIYDLGRLPAVATDAERWELYEYLYDRYPSRWEHAALSVPVAGLVVPGAEASGLIDQEMYWYANAATVDLDGSDVIALLDLSVSREELLVDADCEAVGVGDWTAGLGGVPTKETGTPHGGVRCLRVTDAGEGYAYQTILTVGAAYRASSWIRTDGICTSTAYCGGTALGDNATAAWSRVTNVMVATNVVAAPVYKVAATGGAYAEGDDFSVIRACDAIQPTPANRPVYVADVAGTGEAGVEFTRATPTYARSALVAHTSCTMLFRVYFKAAAGSDECLAGAIDGGGNGTILQRRSTGVLRLRLGNAAAVRDTVATVGGGAWHNIAVAYSAAGVLFYIDGATEAFAALAAPSTNPLWFGTINNAGAPVNSLNAYLQSYRIPARALTAAEIAREFVLMEADVA